MSNFTTLPREAVWAELDKLDKLPTVTRAALIPTSNESCIGFQVSDTNLSIFHRSWGGGTSIDYSLRSVLAERKNGQWLVVADMKMPCPAPPKPERITGAGPVPVEAYRTETKAIEEAELAEVRRRERAYRARLKARKCVRAVLTCAEHGGASDEEINSAAKTLETAVDVQAKLDQAEAELFKLRAIVASGKAGLAMAKVVV